MAISFSNDGATTSNATALGQTAGELQNGFGSGVTGSVYSAIFDAESQYSTAAAANDMIAAYLANSVWGIASDLAANSDWTCADTSSVISSLGGAGDVMPQFYCSGQPPYYTDCGMSGFGGVTIYDASSICPGQQLGYQGGISAFYSSFGSCPNLVLVDGGYGNGINANSLTC